MPAPVFVCAPTSFMCVLRAAIGSDWAATAVMPMAMAATARTVRFIEFPSLVSGLAPGFSDNPGPSLLFLKISALREQAQDHELVNNARPSARIMRPFVAAYSAGCGADAGRCVRRAVAPAIQRHTT